MIIVIDSGVLLKAYFPDEEGHTEAQSLIGDYARGNITFHAPTLITYEIINACLVASKKTTFSFVCSTRFMLYPSLLFRASEIGLSRGFS